MDRKWILQNKKADFRAIGRQFDIDPLIAKVMRNRDLTTTQEYELFLYGGWEQLHDPHKMHGVERGTSILKQKVDAHAKIRIIGDYDIDGVCATYILYQGLKKLGAQVDSAIPDRMTDGYGINENLIRKAYEAGIDTIITCDNGIAAKEQIAYGKSLGMTIVVTDHHDVPYEEVDGVRREMLPPADEVIDPKQEACAYPFDGICGAVVAWKFIQVLYEKYGKSVDETKEFLQFAAMATIGDVMQLRDENRIIVKLGLEQMRCTPCPGLRALMEENKILPQNICSYHIGFVIGPCLNASGRLETAQHALKLLLAQTPQEALQLAIKLKGLNDERKDMTQTYMEQAFYEIDHSDLQNDMVLVVYLPECHESLAGIIAGRIRERYYKPVLVFTDAEDGIKGSGRSIEGYHMFEELTKCKRLFTKYGGHPMAAGVSMPHENLEELRSLLNKNQTLTSEQLVEKVYIDAAMPLGYITEHVIESLDILEPFGNGNAKPVFALARARIQRLQQVGRERKILKMRLSDQTASMEAVYFGDIEHFEQVLIQQAGNEMLNELYNFKQSYVEAAVLYYPAIHEFMGNRTIQITIQDIAPIHEKK